MFKRNEDTRQPSRGRNRSRSRHMIDPHFDRPPPTRQSHSRSHHSGHRRPRIQETRSDKLRNPRPPSLHRNFYSDDNVDRRNDFYVPRGQRDRSNSRRSRSRSSSIPRDILRNPRPPSLHRNFPFDDNIDRRNDFCASRGQRGRSNSRRSRSRSSSNTSAKRRSISLSFISEAAKKRTELVYSIDGLSPVRNRSHRSSKHIDAASPSSYTSSISPRPSLHRSYHTEEVLDRRPDLVVSHTEKNISRSRPRSRCQSLHCDSCSDGAVDERTDYSAQFDKNYSPIISRSPVSGQSFDRRFQPEKDNMGNSDALLSPNASSSWSQRPSRSPRPKSSHRSAHLEEATDKGFKVLSSRGDSHLPSRNSEATSPQLRYSLRGSVPSIERPRSSRRSAHLRPPTIEVRSADDGELHRASSLRKQVPSPPRSIRRSVSGPASARISPPTNLNRPSPSPIDDGSVSEQGVSPPITSRYSDSIGTTPAKASKPIFGTANDVEHRTAPHDQIPDSQSHSRDQHSNLQLPRLMTNNPTGLSDNAPANEPESEPSSSCSGKRDQSSESFSSPSSSGYLMDKEHKYDTLHAQEFRLIRILPAMMSVIQCEIFHVSLDDPDLPPYLALSYAWGDAGDTEKIQLEGTPFSVTVSLHDALDALRERDKTVLVWADALCINQQNRHERTQQVRLMTDVYSKATSVAIWLGKESRDSVSATESLKLLVSKADNPELVTSLISSGDVDLAAIASLFGREYWKRLWVVQEILNSKDTKVYCGSTKLPWSVYKVASNMFLHHKADLDEHLPGGLSHEVGQDQYTLSQVLVHQGPGSLPSLDSLQGQKGRALLHVMRKCRRKLCTDPKDKVFGILGVLQRDEVGFKVDYNLSVKEVYINVVDSLLHTSNRLDVICEAFHFPVHTNTISASLPTWAPDWSHNPATTALGCEFGFSAAGDTQAEYRFIDRPRRNKLEISAVYLGTIKEHGIAVGTLCKLADYLMAFVHWRALLLGSELMAGLTDEGRRFHVEKAFCKTLCLNQVPEGFERSRDLRTACYHVFASSIRERLPHMPLDQELDQYVDANWNGDLDRQAFLKANFGRRMMGRCFCITGEGHMGMGSGFMENDDVVVVPLGCRTPVILRECGDGEYRIVGDIYINKYMEGRAIECLEDRSKELRKYVLN